MEREGSLRHPKIKSILCSRQSLSGIGGTRIRAQVGNDREKSFESSIKIATLMKRTKNKLEIGHRRRVLSSTSRVCFGVVGEEPHTISNSEITEIIQKELCGYLIVLTL
ncbi:hypothetical protein HZH66_014866 [Vespula vulgaris]|uniref:Uncharacterized protein n=2 Tax=Vespula TaxID=7451 RepID=A0A834J0D5_VESVU|nr:hypothetical protein HZH66_014866 [Vespula vulgaris]